jgi:hypothetical protein
VDSDDFGAQPLQERRKYEAAHSTHAVERDPKTALADDARREEREGEDPLEVTVEGAAHFLPPGADPSAGRPMSGSGFRGLVACREALEPGLHFPAAGGLYELARR